MIRPMSPRTAGLAAALFALALTQQGCVAASVAGAGIGVASMAVGAGVKVTGAAVGAVASTAGAAGKALTGGKR